MSAAADGSGSRLPSQEHPPGPLASWPWWQRVLLAVPVVGAGLVLSRLLGVWYERLTSACLVAAAVVFAVRNPRPALLGAATFVAVAAAVLVPMFLLLP